MNRSKLYSQLGKFAPLFEPYIIAVKHKIASRLAMAPAKKGIARRLPPDRLWEKILDDAL
jgi:hypothetical protein